MGGWGVRLWEVGVGVVGARGGKGWKLGGGKVGDRGVKDGVSTVAEALVEEFTSESGRGLPQSKMLARESGASEILGASGSAPAPWRFGSGKAEGRMQNEEGGVVLAWVKSSAWLVAGWISGGWRLLASSFTREWLVVSKVSGLVARASCRCEQGLTGGTPVPLG
jgi:hypothetical protein